jgi:MFS family permease
MMVMVGFSFSQAGFLVYLFPVTMAITMANAPLNWAIIGDFFGRKAYATLRGIMGICYGTATFVSPIYAGWIYDTTGNYKLVFITFSIILMVASASFVILSKPFPIQGEKGYI